MERTLPDQSHETLWAGLPTSNMFKQQRFTGVTDAPAEEECAPRERRSGTIDGDSLRAFALARGVDFNVVMLAAYHLLLQWYLDDIETLVGSCLLASAGAPAATLRPTYVYTEDEDGVDALLHAVAEQTRTERMLHVSESAVWDAGRAPVFYYAGIDGSGTPDAIVAGLDGMRFPEQRVLLAAATAGERTEVVISMPGVVARAIGIDDFQQRYDAILSHLAAGTCATVGELKARLGAANDVPWRQLEEMQRRVIALWARVLAVPEESLDETSSYFEVGGTSLNAFKLINRVRIEFHRDISLRDIVENPTTRELARLLLRR